MNSIKALGFAYRRWRGSWKRWLSDSNGLVIVRSWRLRLGGSPAPIQLPFNLIGTLTIHRLTEGESTSRDHRFSSRPSKRRRFQAIYRQKRFKATSLRCSGCMHLSFVTYVRGDIRVDGTVKRGSRWESREYKFIHWRKRNFYSTLTGFSRTEWIFMDVLQFRSSAPRSHGCKFH